MASIDSSLVRRQIQAMIASSSAIKKQTFSMFETMESNPAEFQELDDIDPSIQSQFKNVTLRKVKLTHGKHDFRVVFAHWTLDDSSEHVDLLFVFPRRTGYRIDWDWVLKALGGSEH